jgi:hypothetical protein
MEIYTVHFVDHGENVWHSENFECDDDSKAVISATAKNVTTIGNGFDLYHGNRLVHRHRSRGSHSK